MCRTTIKNGSDQILRRSGLQYCAVPVQRGRICFDSKRFGPPWRRTYRWRQEVTMLGTVPRRLYPSQRSQADPVTSGSSTLIAGSARRHLPGQGWPLTKASLCSLMRLLVASQAAIVSFGGWSTKRLLNLIQSRDLPTKSHVLPTGLRPSSSNFLRTAGIRPTSNHRKIHKGVV
jgi:hypothetical protein